MPKDRNTSDASPHRLGEQFENWEGSEAQVGAADSVEFAKIDESRTGLLGPKTTFRLPQCSERTVVLVLNAVRRCEPEQMFGKTYLVMEHQIKQSSQALGLLKFLSFLDGQKLSREALAARSDPSLFAALVRRRVGEGYRSAGVSDDLAALLGSGAEWGVIRSALDKSPPFAEVKSPFLRSNMIGAAKALDLVLRNIARDRGWLDTKVQSKTKARNGGTPPSSENVTSKMTRVEIIYGFDEGTEAAKIAYVLFDGAVTRGVLNRIAEKLIELSKKP